MNIHSHFVTEKLCGLILQRARASMRTCQMSDRTGSQKLGGLNFLYFNLYQCISFFTKSHSYSFVDLARTGLFIL